MLRLVGILMLCLLSAEAISQNVGIGTTNPAADFEVVGTVKTDSFQMESGASDGYVLTSDSAGNATWQPAFAHSEMALLVFRTNNGQSAGSPAINAWTNYPINTEKFNNIPGSSFSGNSFTVTPGTYMIEAYAYIRGRSRLRVITDSPLPKIEYGQVTMFPDENQKYLNVVIATTEAQETISLQYLTPNGCPQCLGNDNDKHQNDNGENIFATMKIQRIE